MSALAYSFTPAPVQPHDRLRTFYTRRHRLSARHEHALTTLWPRFGLSVHEPEAGGGTPSTEGFLDPSRLFGRHAPVVLEIGSGMGETTAAMAGADPDRDYLAVETHVAGIANLLALIDDAGLTNVRVAHGDALDLLSRQVRPDSLNSVHVYFPDPWPKLRHHKRRIIQPDNAAMMRSRLSPGGVLHCATDWEPYARVMLAVLDADPELVNAHGGFAPRPDHRPLTKFERRGIALGHDIFDIIVSRAP